MIADIRLVFLRDLHFIFIFIDAKKSELKKVDFDISKGHCEDLSSYQTITFLLQSEQLNRHILLLYYSLFC